MPFWGGSGSGSGYADPCLWLMDPDPDPAIFVIDLPEMTTKKLIFLKFFCLLLFEGRYMYIIFKDKKSKRSHKAVGIKVFLTFLLGDRSIQIRIRIHTFNWWIRIRIQEAQKHVDPDPNADPDLQHWFSGPCGCNENKKILFLTGLSLVFRYDLRGAGGQRGPAAPALCRARPRRPPTGPGTPPGQRQREIESGREKGLS